MQKLFDSEIKVMEIIWENEPISAKQISLIAAEQIGWNKNTTYTVVKKLESKGYIKREIGNRIDLRLLPELIFRLDESIEQGIYISQLIDKVSKEEREKRGDENE